MRSATTGSLCQSFEAITLMLGVGFYHECVKSRPPMDTELSVYIRVHLC